MPVKKLSIAMDQDTAAAAADSAAAAGLSLSAWITAAAEGALRTERGRAAVAEWETEHGALTEEELQEAGLVVDRALGVERADRRAG